MGLQKWEYNHEFQYLLKNGAGSRVKGQYRMGAGKI